MAAVARINSERDDKYQNDKCDLGSFVVSVQKLKRLARPFMTTIRLFNSIIRWRYPLITIITIPACCFLIIFQSEYVIMVTLLSFSLIMLTTFVKSWASKGSAHPDYQHLFRRKDESPDLILKRVTIAKAKEHMELYTADKLEKDKSHTAYMIAGFLLASTIFNSGFIQAIKDGLTFLYNIPSIFTKVTPEPPINAFDEVKPEEIPSDLDTEFKEQDLFEENDIETSSSTDSEDLGDKQEEVKETADNEVDIGRQRERSGLSFVSKFASTFTRKRRKHGGNCTSCNVEFSTILKKRNYCRHCGNSYCSKCCNQRVPKAVFGATAPAAYEERVLVCQSCYSFLMNRIKGTNTEIIE
eukprot:gene19931-21883_t